MKLYYSVPSGHGQPVCVNGNVYQIDDKGFLEVSEEDGQKLVSMAVYRRVEMPSAIPAMADSASGVQSESATPVIAPYREAELMEMSARDLMKLGREMGLKVFGKKRDELIKDILAHENKVEQKEEKPAASEEDATAEAES